MKFILIIVTFLSLAACDEETEHCAVDEIYHPATGLCFYIREYNEAGDVRAWMPSGRAELVMEKVSRVTVFGDE